MRRHLHTVVITLTAAITLALAGCATPPGSSTHYLAYGRVAPTPCHEFLVTSNRERDSINQWLLGFVSGAGSFKTGFGGVNFFDTNPADIEAFAVAYCTDHPNARMMELGQELLAALEIK